MPAYCIRNEKLFLSDPLGDFYRNRIPVDQCIFTPAKNWPSMLENNWSKSPCILCPAGHLEWESDTFLPHRA